MTWFTRARRLSALAGGLAVCALASAPSAFATATSTVNLGQAAGYAVISGASVTNTGNSTVRGDIGAPTQPSGFNPPGTIVGTFQNGSADTAAYNDMLTAYTEIQNRTGGTTLPALAGATLSPGLYTSTGAAGLAASTSVTLNAGGDPNAIFVFQVNGALSLGAGAQVILTGGARASNVFWQVNGAFSLGASNATTTKFAGTALASTTGTIGAGAVVNGRVLAQTAVTLDTDQVYSAPPTMTLTGGAAQDINTPTPTISGTTNVGTTGTVTVTVAGQTLTATPANDGSWSVNPTILANNTYTVSASTTDGAGNVGSATQQLTIDTTPPVITLDGGPTALTNNPTATISGTTDAATGTLITVHVDAQTLTALVQSTGVWNVAPAHMNDGTRTVTAAVTDPAGNTSTATEQLTVDTLAPAVSITGGATALTDSATPTIAGTTDAPTNAVVTVTIADQTLTGTVQSNGTWSVTPTHLSDGAHQVIMTVSDAAGNQATATQTLTVDTVAPVVLITGGANATTTSFVPTISGSTDAAPNRTVTVTIAGQTLTTLVQSDHSWNATPSAVAAGAWQVVASVTDPAGNVGSFTQTLTITAGPTGDTGATGAAGATGPAGSAGATGPAGSAGADGPTGSAGADGPAGNAGANGSAGNDGANGPAGSAGPAGPAGSAGPTGPAGAKGAAGLSLPSSNLAVKHGKHLQIRVALSDPANLTLTVMRGKKVVATTTVAHRRAGNSTLTWSGKIKRGFAPRGAYSVVVKAVTASGAFASVKATLRIT